MQIKTTHYFERDARNERNDCTVRALAAVTGMQYDTAHRIMEEAGRKKGRGLTLHQLKRAMLAHGGGCYVNRGDRPTLTQFAKQHGPGKYVVLVNRHVFALIDDVQYDLQDNGARKRVHGYWEFK